jgi:hypothetical protein
MDLSTYFVGLSSGFLVYIVGLSSYFCGQQNYGLAAMKVYFVWFFFFLSFFGEPGQIG